MKRSLDTNVLFAAHVATVPEHPRAVGLLHQLAADPDVFICELVLVELYMLLRNPHLFHNRPLSAADAAAVCERYRRHPRWLLVESAPVMHEVWQFASREGFARRRIIDARLALTLRHHGVTELITRNVRDFTDFGFARLTNPFE